MTVKRERKRKTGPMKASSAPDPFHPSSLSSPSSSTSSASSMSSPVASVAPALGPTLLPTFVVRKKSRIASAHRSSANRSRIVKRPLPLPVSFCTSANRIFCCGFHCLQCLSRCSRVCVLYWHHPHFALSAFFVHSKYWPVRQCPRSDLVEARSVQHSIRPTARHTVFLLVDSPTAPGSRLLPFFLGNFPLDAGYWEWHPLFAVPIAVA